LKRPTSFPLREKKKNSHLSGRGTDKSWTSVELREKEKKRGKRGRPHVMNRPSRRAARQPQKKKKKKKGRGKKRGEGSRSKSNGPQRKEKENPRGGGSGSGPDHAGTRKRKSGKGGDKATRLAARLRGGGENSRQNRGRPVGLKRDPALAEK